jgi:CHAD domain-containing protein
MRYCFAVVTTKKVEMNAAVLSIRLLAVLQKLPDRADKEDVHQLRTTVRRLEAHLGKCPPKIAKALKLLRREAGKVRDIDVHSSLLRPALLPRTLANRDAISRLHEILKTRRDRHLVSLRDALVEAAPLLVAKLPALAESAASSLDGIHDAAARVERARQRYLQWTRNVPNDAERLHRLRINTKKLRYSLESFPDFEEAADLVAKFKQVQDAIGSWHDWATLAQLAERKLESPQAEPLRSMLRARTGREYRKSRRTVASVRTWISGEPTASAKRKTSQQLIGKAD